MDEPTLAHYQRALLVQLRAGAPPARIREALSAHPGLQGALDYIEQLDDDALLIAARLVRQWARS